MPGELYSGLKMTLPALSHSHCVCRQFSKGSFIDLYLISLQYSNRASVLQSVADLSTSLKLPKFVSVCMRACKCVCALICVCGCV